MSSKKDQKKRGGSSGKSTAGASQPASPQGSATASTAHASPVAASAPTAPAAPSAQAHPSPKPTIGVRLKNWTARFTWQQKAAAVVFSGVLTYFAVAGITFPSWAEKWREWFPAWTSDRTGYLIPANVAAPVVKTCPTDTPPGTARVFLGSNAYLISKTRKRSSFLVIEGVPVVEFELTDKGQLKVWAEVVDQKGASLAKVSEDFDWVADRRVAAVHRSSSQVLVTGPDGTEIFNVRFLNPNAVEIAGTFSARGSVASVKADARGLYLINAAGVTTATARGTCLSEVKPMVVKDGIIVTMF